MKRRISIAALLVVLVLCLAGVSQTMEAQASGKNLVKQTSQAKAGYWRKDAKGWWHQYYNGKYPKNKWLKIDGKIYFFNKKGYMATGRKKYQGSVYFLKKSGALHTGWKTIKGKRYYFSPETGAAVTGWQTIGSETYCFRQNGVMYKNCTVDGIKLDKKGRQVISSGSDAAISTAPAPEENEEAALIFVGDSRTVGLQQTIGGDAKYIGKVGEGYAWFTKTALKKLKKELEAAPASTVILNFGINDLGNISSYIVAYQELMASYPQARFLFASIHPVEQKLAKKSGYTVTNKQIQAFNAQLQAAFPENYVDTYSYLMESGQIKPKGNLTSDGIHYTAEGYQLIYNYIQSQM